MVIGINCGHTVSGTIGCGAVGILNESDETRNIGYKLIEKLRSCGHKVIDCTNDRAATVNENLRQICSIANSVNLDAFYSIHLNSGGGHGTECYTYGGKDKANASTICSNMAKLGFTNRGVKDGSKLYVVKNTTAPACLIEVCFVDTQSDADLYHNVGADKIAQAICNAITGSNSQPAQEEQAKDKYEQLLDEVNAMKTHLDEFIDARSTRYQTAGETPTWAEETIQKLVDNGFLKGDGNGLNLTDDLVRMLVIMDRAGVFDKES